MATLTSSSDSDSPVSVAWSDLTPRAAEAQTKARACVLRQQLAALHVVPLSPASVNSGSSIHSSDGDNLCLSPTSMAVCQESTTVGASPWPMDHVAHDNNRCHGASQLLPQAKAMPMPCNSASSSSLQTQTCHSCVFQESTFVCNRCNLPTCCSCRFRRWETCKTCFWKKEEANLLSTGFPIQDLKNAWNKALQLKTGSGRHSSRLRVNPML